MRKGIVITVGMLAMLLLSTPATAQEAHITGEAELHQAVVGQADAAEAKRAAIRALLRRPEVRDVAADAGLDIVKAERAVGLLSGPDLNRVAGYVNQINAQSQIIGGVDRIVISATTLIIILLVIIILLLV